jgi:hypothetical protein
MLPCLQLLDLQLHEVVQQLLHLVLLTPELVLQLLVQELDIKQMPKLLGLQLVELLVVQLAVQQLGPLVVQVHSQVPLVQNSSLVQILELEESRLLMHQQQVLYLLLELLNLVLLVCMF